MDAAIEELIESGQRLRVIADWLAQPIEGYVNDRIWRAGPDTIFFVTDDHEIFAFDLTEPSLRIIMAGAPGKNV